MLPEPWARPGDGAGPSGAPSPAPERREDWFRGPGLLLLAVLVLATACGGAACGDSRVEEGVWRRVGERNLEAGAWETGLPFFDPRGRLAWDPTAAGPLVPCASGGSAQGRIPRIHRPRVVELVCGSESAPRRELVGLDEADAVGWRRPLAYLTGEYRIEEWVLGADPGALVLSDLEVVSPTDGKTLFPAPSHPIPGEDRSVPNFELHGSALFRPAERDFLFFAADVTLVRREGGLYRLDPASGEREVLLPVRSTLAGGYWSVEQMLMGTDGRTLFLAEKLAVRGPGGVAFAVADLAERRIVYREVFAEGRYAQSPRLVRGPTGTVGFSLVDETADRVVLVEFRRGSEDAR